jgi:hypothetical protein
MTSVAKQRISKHALTIEAMFSAWSAQSGYKEVFGSIERVIESSSEASACQNVSLGAEEVNCVVSSELAVTE